MPRVTRHGKARLVQRDEAVDNFSEAKRTATIAWRSGSTINEYNIYPHFFEYLTNKKSQSNSCSIRIYRGNIYIWRGKKNNRSLVTSHPIPDRYLAEMAEVDGKQEEVWQERKSI